MTIPIVIDHDHETQRKVQTFWQKFKQKISSFENSVYECGIFVSSRWGNDQQSWFGQPKILKEKKYISWRFSSNFVRVGHKKVATDLATLDKFVAKR